MNIFFLSWDPKLCAQEHSDRHVVKMILETAQMLYTACWYIWYEYENNIQTYLYFLNYAFFLLLNIFYL